MWEDCTKRNYFQALAAGLNPAGKMTLDQFTAIFLCVQGSFHRSLGANTRVRPMSNTAIQRIHQRCGAQLCLPKMWSFYLKFLLRTMPPHIELPNCRYNQRFPEITSHFCFVLSFTALIDTDLLYKSFITPNSNLNSCLSGGVSSGKVRLASFRSLQQFLLLFSTGGGSIQMCVK